MTTTSTTTTDTAPNGAITHTIRTEDDGYLTDVHRVVIFPGYRTVFQTSTRDNATGERAFTTVHTVTH